MRNRSYLSIYDVTSFAYVGDINDAKMLGNIRNGISLLSRDKNILFKRNNLSQVIFNIRNKQSTVSTKDQHRATETDDVSDEPIKFSSSKAASMRINEYRQPYQYEEPWYQAYSIMFSMAAFLIYFCILREENDIDSMLYTDLEDTLKKVEKSTQKGAKS